jgi:hypothetical protein
MDQLDLDNEKFKHFFKNNFTNTLNYILTKKLKNYNVNELNENIKINIELNKSIINSIKDIRCDFNHKMNHLEDKFDNMNKEISKLTKENNLLHDIKKNKKNYHSMSDLNNCLSNSSTVFNNNDIKTNIDNFNDNNIDNIDNNIYDIDNNIYDSNNENYENENKKNDKNENKNKKNKKNENKKNDDIINNNLIYKELKNEDFSLYFDFDFLKKCLHSTSINSDLKIFKKIYIDDIPCGYYSIRNIKKKYQYWLNGIMYDDDDNGTYIKNTITSNIYNCYLKINNYDNYADDLDQFIKNQEYILTLNDQKYKDKLFNHIIKIIQVK